MNSIAAGIAALLLFASTASAQWTKDPAGSIPRTREGKPNLSARAPKTRDGKIDLSGVWLADADPKGTPAGVENQVFPQYFINIAADLKQDAVPFQPEAQALFLQRLQNRGIDSPPSHCKPTGVPMLNAVPLPTARTGQPQVIII